jgi:hypothetical protein
LITYLLFAKRFTTTAICLHIAVRRAIDDTDSVLAVIQKVLCLWHQGPNVKAQAMKHLVFPDRVSAFMRAFFSAARAGPTSEGWAECKQSLRIMMRLCDFTDHDQEDFIAQISSKCDYTRHDFAYDSSTAKDAFEP